MLTQEEFDRLADNPTKCEGILVSVAYAKALAKIKSLQEANDSWQDLQSVSMERIRNDACEIKSMREAFICANESEGSFDDECGLPLAIADVLADVQIMLEGYAKHGPTGDDWLDVLSEAVDRAESLARKAVGKAVGKIK